MALERFIAHTKTFARIAGYSVDGRVALPTTVEKISLKKPAHKYVVGQILSDIWRDKIILIFRLISVST